MEALRAGLDLDGFFRKLAEATARVLLLDYDGTLAPFREERDRAVPYPGVRERVAALVSGGRTRVVVVSGRSVEAVRPLLGVEPPPEIWGNHGWERYTADGGLERSDPGERARRGLADGTALARDRVSAGRVEVKPVSVAVHTRGAAAHAAREILGAVRPEWARIAAGTGLEVHDFDGGLELRVPGRDKGTAVRAILGSEPGDAMVAYLGDDRTDEDAFAALDPEGGRVLRVLVRDEPRATEADLWIRPPEELMVFLGRWEEASSA